MGPLGEPPRKMLTGEELCTSGEATLGGFDIKTQQNQVGDAAVGMGR